MTLPLGLEPEFWRTRHVHYHHHYANIEHYDLDTEEMVYSAKRHFNAGGLS